MGDWLGSGSVATFLRVYRPFKEARDFVHKLRLKNIKEWIDYCKSGEKPDDIPSTPDKTYSQDGWKGLGDWLGTGTVASFLRQYKSFEEAREFVHKLKLNSSKEWWDYCKSGQKPDDIPTNPNKNYKQNGWKGLGDWLGIDYNAIYLNRNRDFIESKEFVHKLKLKSRNEWKYYCKSGNKPDYIPSHPDGAFKHYGWKGWGDWLGTGSVSTSLRVYKSFEEARDFVHNLKLKGYKEWRDYCKSGQKPVYIPTTPDKIYKHDGWKGMRDWLGYSN